MKVILILYDDRSVSRMRQQFITVQPIFDTPCYIVVDNYTEQLFVGIYATEESDFSDKYYHFVYDIYCNRYELKKKAKLYAQPKLEISHADLCGDRFKKGHW